MEYTPIEKQALDMMRRTDFRNLSKTDVLSIASKLSELRPDVAKEVIAQFPEYVDLIQSSMSGYKDILGNIISSVTVASSVFVAGLVIGVSVFGGNVNIKLPKKV